LSGAVAEVVGVARRSGRVRGGGEVAVAVVAAGDRSASGVGDACRPIERVVRVLRRLSLAVGPAGDATEAVVGEGVGTKRPGMVDPTQVSRRLVDISGGVSVRVSRRRNGPHSSCRCW